MVVAFPPQGAANDRNPRGDGRVDLKDAPRTGHHIRGHQEHKDVTVLDVTNQDPSILQVIKILRRRQPSLQNTSFQT